MPVVVEGYDELMRSLKNFAPALKVELDEKIEAVMLPIRDKARGYAPVGRVGGLYNWQKSYRANKSGPQTPLLLLLIANSHFMTQRKLLNTLCIKKVHLKKIIMDLAHFLMLAIFPQQAQFMKQQAEFQGQLVKNGAARAVVKTLHDHATPAQAHNLSITWAGFMVLAISAGV